MQNQNPLALQSGKAFWKDSSGRWAGERMLEALQEGRDLQASDLRVNGVLRQDEWIQSDEALVTEAVRRMTVNNAIVAAGLTRQIPNSMGTTVWEYEKMSDMLPATVSLDGMVRTEDDRVDFTLAQLPIPITHKDFGINLRTLQASRKRGEGLDVTQIRIAGRLIGEAQEQMTLTGSKTFGGLTIYGLLNHPDRNTASFGTNGAWSAAAKTGENILVDLQTMIAALEADRMMGPYWLIIPRNTNVKLDGDFKTNSDKSIRTRLLELTSVTRIMVADFLTADNILLIQATSDTIELLQGEPLQTVQWDLQGGFRIEFKGFMIQVPLIRSDASGRSGIVHMS